jgi:hypothetical protein
LHEMHRSSLDKLKINTCFLQERELRWHLLDGFSSSPAKTECSSGVLTSMKVNIWISNLANACTISSSMTSGAGDWIPTRCLFECGVRSNHDFNNCIPLLACASALKLSPHMPSKQQISK